MAVAPGAAKHYPARMIYPRLLPMLCGALLVSGCTSFDTTTETPSEPPQCPPPPQLECPVCPAVPECPAPVANTPEPALAEPTPRTAGELQLPVIGAIEWVAVESAGIRMAARIDTGAETTSIHAENINLVERDGKRYVRFTLRNPDTGEAIAMEERLKRRVLIKQHEGEPERRYVVRLWLTLGETRTRVQVNLTDREVFEFPLLIGRNVLTDTAIVDVSQQYLLGR